MPELLKQYGYHTTLQERFLAMATSPGLEAARVVCRHNHIYDLVTATGFEQAVLPGSLRRGHLVDVPATGDWVILHRGTKIIAALLPRLNVLIRKAAGEEDRPQVLAANSDQALIVSGLDHDYNPRRLERLLSLAHEAGIPPVIVLNKRDLLADEAAVTTMVAETRTYAPGIPVHAVSATCKAGLDALAPYLYAGRTLVLIGSSGVGKSSLVNVLAEGTASLPTTAVRAGDSRGRHTTTRRELILLPGGALLLDTPGLREIALHEEDGGLADTFTDIEETAAGCRFRDCRHEQEPGCAVRAACEAGRLQPERLAAYAKLLAERAAAAARNERRADQSLQKRRALQSGKSLARITRKHPREPRA